MAIGGQYNPVSSAMKMVSSSIFTFPPFALAATLFLMNPLIDESWPTVHSIVRYLFCCALVIASVYPPRSCIYTSISSRAGSRLIITRRVNIAIISRNLTPLPIIRDRATRQQGRQQKKNFIVYVYIFYIVPLFLKNYK